MEHKDLHDFNHSINSGNSVPVEKAIKRISKLLIQIAQSQSQRKKQYSTCFDINHRVDCSFYEYVYNVFNQVNPSLSALVFSLALIDRLTSKGFALNLKNLFKVFAISMMISIKWLEDEVMHDKTFAILFGISPSELIYLETVFLEMIDYQLHIDFEVFEKYSNILF